MRKTAFTKQLVATVLNLEFKISIYRSILQEKNTKKKTWLHLKFSQNGHKKNLCNHIDQSTF